MNHSVHTSEQATAVSTPLVAESGIPFVVGISPVFSASAPMKAGVPVLITRWDEAVEKLGYSEDWKKYGLCEFMYSHFKLFSLQPVIFCNVLDVAKVKTAADAADFAIKDHKAVLPFEALIDETLVVKAGDTALSSGTDYDCYYSNETLIVELLSDSTSYGAQSLNISYSKVDVTKVTTADIAAGIESVELCLTKCGIIPDEMLSPGYSSNASIAAAMTAKAANINGLFHAKALKDIPCGKDGALTYSEAIEYKNKNNFTDKDDIICWPMVKLDNRIFHLTSQLAGLIAQTDTENGGVPYESPSNKALKCNGLCLEGGTEVDLTLAEANLLNSNGIITALNFVNGWCVWGNYTGCYPSNTDIKDHFLPIGRMFGWVANSLIKTFWSKLDKPMTRRLVDNIVDTANIWLNGLVGQEYLLGARVECLESENPLSNLMAGIIKLHIYLTPPSPSQEIDFVLEYDASYLEKALTM
ncbi:MAG: phage tail protein [Clostridia bacterium]|nr:phage tail protein [Clostridia bacterium]